MADNPQDVNAIVAAAVAKALADKEAADAAKRKAQAEAEQIASVSKLTRCIGCGGGGRRGGDLCPDCHGSGAENDTQRYKDAQAAASESN